MPPITIRSPPALDSFTPLAEHQSQTPASFFGAKPILYYHLQGGQASIAKSQVSKLPIFSSQSPAAQVEASNGAATENEPSVVETVDVFVSSENLTLFNPSSSTGIEIPYPSISIHAIQRLPDPNDASKELQGLYMQLELSESSEDEEDMPDIIELTLTPALSSNDASPATTVQDLFEAVSNCSNLHPDPGSKDDEDMEDGDDRIVFEGGGGFEGVSGLPGVVRGATDGGLPPPFPGSGGWITAENVSEYFDQEGNWIGGEEEEEGEGEALGEGAGRVRARDEVESEETPQVNGNGREDGEENKRTRTE